MIFETGNGGARVELDGQVHAELEERETTTFELRLDPGFATLVSLGEEESTIAGLRRRRILIDSPRVLARDDRERGAQPSGTTSKPSARSAARYSSKLEEESSSARSRPSVTGS